MQILDLKPWASVRSAVSFQVAKRRDFQRANPEGFLFYYSAEIKSVLKCVLKAGICSSTWSEYIPICGQNGTIEMFAMFVIYSTNNCSSHAIDCTCNWTILPIGVITNQIQINKVKVRRCKRIKFAYRVLNKVFVAAPESAVVLERCFDPLPPITHIRGLVL